jgi:hypothetical protein
MRNPLLPALFLVAASPALAQPGPFQPTDLQYAIHVCTDTSYLAVSGEAGPGEVADLDAINRGCMVGNEMNGVWMHVQVATGGQLAFTLTPTQPRDLDFAVWGPFSAPVTALVAPPVRCSYAAGPGSTGMNYTAVDLSEFAGGDRWVRYLDVLPGEWYMVYINQFSTLDLHFAMNWQLQGGASLACLEAPVADFTGPVAPVLPGALVGFTDASTNYPYAWYWEFPGGEPATSVERDPQGIVYTGPGCHDVQLTVYNAVGSATVSRTCAVECGTEHGGGRYWPCGLHVAPGGRAAARAARGPRHAGRGAGDGPAWARAGHYDRQWRTGGSVGELERWRVHGGGGAGHSAHHAEDRTGALSRCLGQ